jgi:hypothetical protein
LIVINSLSSLVFSIVATSFAIYGISTIVAMEPGPFAIFDRIREALLPGQDTIADMPEPFMDSLMMEQPEIVTEQAQAIFDRTFKGTIHGIFDCVICFGLWVSIPLATMPIVLGLVDWAYCPLIWLTSYGLFRFLLGVAGDI